jgi:phosphoribosylaminoimidazolecarboxamide formyltransferase/IMP cyclohydrolase
LKKKLFIFNACGVALGDALVDAYLKANMADRVAAFGGCIALNRAVDKATAEAIVEQYAEVVVTPDFEPGVIEVFTSKKKICE